MQTILEIIQKLREENYSHDFKIVNGAIITQDSDKHYKPGELIIEKTFRYEGDSNPDDNAIVYAITAKDGTQGVLVDSYGAYSDAKVAQLIKEIPVREENELQDSKTD